MKQDFVTLNGQKVNGKTLKAEPKELKVFKRKWMGDPAIPEFIEAWWDSKSTIPAYTSGSTGIPRRIALGKDYAIKSAQATLDILGLKPGDTALLSMPAHYIAGRMMIIRAIVGQLNLVTIGPTSEPKIPEQTIDMAAFTPHQFQSILDKEPANEYYRVKNILLGGSAVPDDLISQVTDFPGQIYETYGMTETYSHIALRKLYPDHEPYFEAVGSTTFSLDGENLIIHAPHLGIKKLHTNDTGELDGPTRFRWLGRADYVINSGGIKLHPESIESKLRQFIKTPFFITGKSDKKYGKVVALVMEKHSDALPEKQLKKIIPNILDKYEKPKTIIWVDKIIMTPTGKINRKATTKKNKI